MKEENHHPASSLKRGGASAIAQNIIQILLFEGGSLKKAEISKILDLKINIVEENISEIKNLLAVINLNLVQTPSSLEICLSNKIATLVNKQKIEELMIELSESALQTLSVVIYKNLATKAEIDFIRGVDSSRSIKNLLTRGLIERMEMRSRKYYIPTTETLKYLNLENVENAPDQTEISVKLKVLIEGEKD